MSASTVAVVLRSAGGAAVFGSVWLLFAAGAALAWRRRSLSAVVEHLPSNPNRNQRIAP